MGEVCAELFDKQVNVQKESLKKNTGFMQSVMKMKEVKKTHALNFFDGRKKFRRCVQKSGGMDSDECYDQLQPVGQ